MTRTLRIGTRGSELALWQAQHVAARLREAAGIASELVVVRTSGDRDRSRPLHQLAGSGFFTRELQQALLEGRVDAVVHSLKDLPVDEPPGLTVSAVLGREEPRDALLAPPDRRGPGGLGLRPGAVLGTSSLRRAAQALALQPELVIKPLRGNVPTRLRRLEEGEVDAILLAYAGLCRLGIDPHDRLLKVFEVDEFLPAPGQGALAVETRQGSAADGLASLLHQETLGEATACERELLRQLGGGCHMPLGAFAVPADGQLRLTAVLGELDADLRHASLRRASASGSDRREVASAVARALAGGANP
ncbi:MAG: hydroxymethylbilane synthase [Thermoanaerobaculaceae bacterium]|nr:hydroxymethylbilane synthase [Thermoanaerobaculaceae bacterium]